METRFTPGPWSTCTASDCNCGFVSCHDFPICKVTVGDWGDNYPALRLVGESSLVRRAEAYMEQITYGSVDPETARANARLIAAAPDLYEALAKLTEVCEKQPRLHQRLPDPGSPLGLARAALAKARGE